MVMSMTACGSKDQPSSSGSGSGSSGNTASAIKIGGIGPKTGSSAVYGLATEYGAQVAVKEINALGGIQFEIK